MKHIMTILIAVVCMAGILCGQSKRHRYPPPVTFEKNISLKTKPHSFSAVSVDTSSGVAWGPVIKLSMDDPYPSGGNYTPRLVAQGDTIHCIWYGGSYRLPYRRSTDGGFNWEDMRELLTDSIEFSSPPGWKVFVQNHQKIFIFFAGSHPSGYSPIYFMESTDRGESWSYPVEATSDTTGNIVSASVNNDTMSAVYSPGTPVQRPRITRSINAGSIWTKNPIDMPSSSSNQLRVALTPGLLNFFHPGDRWPGSAPEIVLHRSTDLADTWIDSTVLSPIDGYGSDVPEVAIYERSNCGVKSSIIAVMWRGEEWGGGLFSAGMAVRISYDNGKTWQPYQLVSDVPYGSFHNVTIKGNVMAVTWVHEGSDFAGPFQIKARISLDGGETWKAVTNLTPQPSAWATYSNIAISDSAIHVVWEEDTEPVGSRWNIFYCRGKIIRPPVRGTVISYQPRWNLVSLPVIPESTYRLPSLFTYENGYITADSMVKGKGYWTKFGWVGESVDYVGAQINSCTLSVNEQWNIIGGLSSPLAAQEVQSIPSGLIISPFYGYNNCAGYFQTDSLYPGMGYWVKANQAGMLIMSSGNWENATALNRVKIIDDGEMPPPPPDGVLEESSDEGYPKEFYLEQNYPNPFNPMAYFRFRILDFGFVTLKVFDLLGREVATLVNEKKSPGEYTVTWEASGVTSGVYYYRLMFYDENKGLRTMTKKMILIK